MLQTAYQQELAQTVADNAAAKQAAMDAYMQHLDSVSKANQAKVGGRAGCGAAWWSGAVWEGVLHVAWVW